MIFIVSCQKKPALGPAGDPMSALQPPPMGSNTYNDELKTELLLLDDLLEKRINEQHLLQIKKTLLEGSINTSSLNTKSTESAIVKLLLTLPELIHKTNIIKDVEKRWLKAKYLFQKRRFIEAAMLMTEVLKEDPTTDEIRNLRARAIFFLGNPDLAVSELAIIVDRNGENSPHGLDALYLMGAIIFESNDSDQKRIDIGVRAWTRYMEFAKIDDSFKKEMSESIAELKRRPLRPDAHFSADFVDPFSPKDSHPAQKNAVFTAFLKDELLLAEQLAEDYLKKNYDADIATIKARIFFKTGRMEEAKNLFTSIVEKNDNYAPGHHYRGMAFMMQGEPKNAIMSWKKTLAINPHYAQFYNLEQRIAAAQKMIEPTKIETH